MGFKKETTSVYTIDSDPITNATKVIITEEAIKLKNTSGELVLSTPQAKDLLHVLIDHFGDPNDEDITLFDDDFGIPGFELDLNDEIDDLIESSLDDPLLDDCFDDFCEKDPFEKEPAN